MTSIRLGKSLFALYLSSYSCAFCPPTSHLTPRLITSHHESSFLPPLNLEGPADGARLTSGRKEIAFDSATNRFFETGLEDEDCIPSQEFCLIDPKTSEPIRLTVEEKERMFLDALQSYYVSGRQVMDDADFDSLKEDLAWNGSSVVVMNKKEMMYLAAMEAYTKGEPILSDAEFDQLRDDLREEGSKIAVTKEPKCYIETGVCTVNFQKDNFRSNLLYLPASSILLLLWLGIGYEIIGGRINPIVLGSLGIPVVAAMAKSVTDNFLFRNNFIAYGPCPTCEVENRVYFGDILGVEGFDKVASVKCVNCKSQINVQKRSLRASTLPKDD